MLPPDVIGLSDPVVAPPPEAPVERLWAPAMASRFVVDSRRAFLIAPAPLVCAEPRAPAVTGAPAVETPAAHEPAYGPPVSRALPVEALPVKGLPAEVLPVQRARLQAVR